MNDQLELPARRALPPQTRERIRRRVMTATEPRRGGRHPGRPLSVAAAVVLLAAGAAVGGQVLRDPGGHAPGARTATPAAEAPGPEFRLAAEPVQQADVDRCRAAMSSRDVAGQDRERSNPRFAVPLVGRTLIVFDPGAPPGVPQFCELTRTSAVLSQPAAQPRELVNTDEGSLLAGTFSSPNGTLAGVATPQLAHLNAAYRSDDGRHVVQAATLVEGGVFVIQPIGIPGPELGLTLTLVNTAGTAAHGVEADRGNELAGHMVDQWPSGDPDPTAPVNQLARCVDRTLINGIGVPAPDSWQPGARTPWQAFGGVLVARDGEGQVRICMIDDAGRGVALNPPIEGRDDWQRARPFTLAHQHETPDTVVTVAGTVTPAVSKVELAAPGGAAAPAQVVDGTYAGRLEGAVSIRMFDANGGVLYDGPILP